MRTFLTPIFCLFFGFLSAQSSGMHQGFFNFHYHSPTGKISLEIPKDRLGKSFLYVNSLSSGVGSNDLGLDRGQLGDTRVVQFELHGDKVLLIQENLQYRAVSENDLERRAVEEAFAKSVIWGFKVESSDRLKVMVDLTPMLLSDMHKVTERLKDRDQGTYKLDLNRSAIYMDRTKNFPKNSEFEAILTFAGKPKGAFIQSVTPSPDAVTVRQHHSFIELPDDNYKPRVFHPYSGYFSINYFDYASPIDVNMQKIFISRHRLEKKNPELAMSEAVEPIIYYIDPGCPEPVKSALIEGGSWWNQAFEAAGFKDAFMIKELPAGADPLDVRYNMIQWVHRSTRGWSYGASVRDPRTGEIIKGHVSLGSLRVRQDYMIAQALLSPFGDDDSNTSPMKEMALARLRQLSAHEIGHTIGLAHNFAASVNDRASVMDYPHPYIQLKDGKIDFSNAYDDKIGGWDKRAIIYGYSDFPDGVNEEEALQEIINETIKQGFHYISDPDARPEGGSHSLAHLWDNGANAAEELLRIMEIRRIAIDQFGQNTIQNGTPYSSLEKIFVPLYLLHRYQIEAASKLIGGYHYTYATKGDAHKQIMEAVSEEQQLKAVDALLKTLEADQLSIPSEILNLFPPPALGYPRDRESFSNYSGLTFGSTGAIEALSHHTLSLMLHPERLSLLNEKSSDQKMSLPSYLKYLRDRIFKSSGEGESQHIDEIVQNTFFIKLLALAGDEKIDKNVAAESLFCLYMIRDEHLSDNTAHDLYLSNLLERFSNGNKKFELPGVPAMPPGSPIGCDSFH